MLFIYCFTFSSIEVVDCYIEVRGSIWLPTHTHIHDPTTGYPYYLSLFCIGIGKSEDNNFLACISGVSSGLSAEVCGVVIIRNSVI